MSEIIRFTHGPMNFSQSQSEEITFHQEDLIQLYPFGVSLATDDSRPILLLKDEKSIHTLPVPLNTLEAGVTLSQANKAVAPVTPHKFTELLMASLDIKAQQCVFVQIKGAHQFVRIYLSGHASQNSIKLRADEAMSLCLHLGIPIFATLSFINQSKVLTAELQGMNDLGKRDMHMRVKTHPYVM